MMRMQASILLALVACATLVLSSAFAESDVTVNEPANIDHYDLEAAASETHVAHTAEVPDMEPSEGIIHEITAEGRSMVGDFIRNWRSRVETAVRKTFTGAPDDDSEFDVGVRRPVAVIPPMGHPMQQIRAPNLGPANGRHPGNNNRRQQPGHQRPGQANIHHGYGNQAAGQLRENYGSSAGGFGSGHFQTAPAAKQKPKWRPAAAIEVEIELPHQTKNKYDEPFKPIKQQKSKPSGSRKPTVKFPTTTEAVPVVTASPWNSRAENYGDYPANFADYSDEFSSQPAKNTKPKSHAASKKPEKKAQYKLSGFVGGKADEHVFDVGASLTFGGGSSKDNKRPEFTKGHVTDVPVKARGSTKHFPAPANPEPAPPKYEKRQKSSKQNSQLHTQPRQKSSKSHRDGHQKKQESVSSRSSSSSEKASPVYQGSNQMKGWNRKSKPEAIHARHSASQKRQDHFEYDEDDFDDEAGFFADKPIKQEPVKARTKSAPAQEKLKPQQRGQTSTVKHPQAAASRDVAGYGSKTNKKPWTPSQVMYSRNFTQYRYSQYPVTDSPTAATEDVAYVYETGPARYSGPKLSERNEYYYSGTKTSKYHQAQIQNAQKDHSPVRRFLKIVRSSLASEGLQFPTTDLLTRARIPLGAVSDMVHIIAALRTSMDPSMDAFLRGTFTDATEKIAGYLKHLVPFDLPMSYFLHGKFLMDRLTNLTSFLSHTHPQSWDRAKNAVSSQAPENSATATTQLADESSTEPAETNEVPTARRSKRSPQDMPKEASEISPSYYGWYREYLKQESPSKRQNDIETCKDLGFDYYQEVMANPGRKSSNKVDLDRNFESDPVFDAPDRVQIMSGDSYDRKQQKKSKKNKKKQNKNKQPAGFEWDSADGFKNQPNKNGKKKNGGKKSQNRDDALYVDDYIDYSDLSLLPNTYEKTRKKAVVDSAVLASPGGVVARPGKEDYVYYYYYDDEEEDPNKNSPKNKRGQGKNRNKGKNQESQDEDKKQGNGGDEYDDDASYEDEPQGPSKQQRPQRQTLRQQQGSKPRPGDEEYYDYYYDDDEQPGKNGKGGNRRPPSEDNYQQDEEYDDGETKKQSNGRLSFLFGRNDEGKNKQANRGRNKKNADSRKDPWYKSLRMPRISMPKPDLSILKKLDPRSVVSSIKRQDPFVTFGGLSFGAFIAALMYAVMSDVDPGVFSQSKFSELGQFDILQVYDRMSELLARDPALRTKRSYGSKIGQRQDDEDGILLPEDDVSRSSANDDDRTELRCAMDSLWTAYEDDPLAKQCLRLALCQSIVEAPAVKSDKNYSMRVLLLTTFSWMLGDQESFQFANDVEDQVIRRTGFKCTELSPLCRASKKKYMAKLASEIK